MRDGEDGGVTLEDALRHRDVLVVRPKSGGGEGKGGLFGAAASLLSEIRSRGAAEAGGYQAVRILSDHPMNARLELARLVAHTLSLKANLRQRLHQAYVLEELAQLQHSIDAHGGVWRQRRSFGSTTARCGCRCTNRMDGRRSSCDTAVSYPG